MRKNVIYLMACTAVVILATSCVDISKDGTVQKTVPGFVLTRTEDQAEDYPTTQGAYKFTELVYEETGGRIEVQVNADGVLGNEKTVIEQLQLGGVDLARVSLSPLTEFVPKLNVLQVSYLYTGREYMWEVLEGLTGTDFMNSFGGFSPVSLSWYDAGACNLYSMNRPTESLDGTKRLKIRAQGSGLMMDTIQALRAAPVPMAFGDVYSDLQIGEVDRAENNRPSYKFIRHCEAAQYFVLNEHTKVPELQLAVQSTWDKLSEEHGNTTRGCTQGSALYEHELQTERERASEDRVRGAGCVVAELDVREKERFREAAASMHEKYCPEYADIIDDAMDAGRQ